MKFEALYYPEKLHVINETADVGIVTLWSPVDTVLKVLTELDIDLDPCTSRIAAVGNLFGNGLPHLLRNLLWNPQLVHLVVLGQNLSGSREDLIAFFEQGIAPTDFLGTPAYRIVGRERIIDGLATPEQFQNGIRVSAFGKISDSQTREALVNFFSKLPSPREPQADRQNIPIPEVSVQRYPSEPRGQTIVRDTPLEAWEELMFRLVRFGHHGILKKGKRTELQNVHVVVRNPVEEPAERLAVYHFSLAHFHDYQRYILDPQPPVDDNQPYTYGNRLRGYFRRDSQVIDQLEMAVVKLREDPEARDATFTLWDPTNDPVSGRSAPCLIEGFFRRFEGKLTLSAVFRTHNARTAWLENFYGLMAIQGYAAERVNMPPGPITVFSHSISIAEEVLGEAKAIADSKVSDEMVDPATGKREPRFDPNGNFTVTIDRDSQEIVVQHHYEGMVLTEYRDRSAPALEKLIARDCAVSEISHALYLGREMAKAEEQLRQLKRKRSSD